jgi:Na+-transporting methylmalonyl-CoA/oxaloacetate decarboxylase gamma subunit
MSDFIGMGGALVVCVIAQSIVFAALAIMAGVIYFVGVVAGDKNNLQPPAPITLPAAAAEQTEDEGEITAVITASITQETSGGEPARINPESGSNWRIVSLQEASNRRNLK